MEYVKGGIKMKLMFKSTLVALIMLLLLSCAGTGGQGDGSSKEQKVIPPDIKSFLNDVALAASQKDKSKLIKMLDRDYKEKQYDGLFKKNTDDFLNEFFCGRVVGGQENHCINFPDITKVSLIDVIINKDHYIGQFEVTTDAMSIHSNLKSTKKVVTYYGVYGSLGITQVEPEMPNFKE